MHLGRFRRGLSISILSGLYVLRDNCRSVPLVLNVENAALNVEEALPGLAQSASESGDFLEVGATFQGVLDERKES